MNRLNISHKLLNGGNTVFITFHKFFRLKYKKLTERNLRMCKQGRRDQFDFIEKFCHHINIQRILC